MTNSATVTYETHTVKTGESLSSIAKDLWGDTSRWTRLAEANAIVAPYTIRAGQKLLVPVTYLPTIPITKGVAVNAWPFALILIVGAFFLLGARRRG